MHQPRLAFDPQLNCTLVPAGDYNEFPAPKILGPTYDQ